MKVEKVEKETKCCAVISPDVVKSLESQLVQEMHNMRIYQKFATYFNNVGLNDLVKYYRTRANEELQHYTNICEFLENNLVDYNFHDIPKIDIEIKDSIEPFEMTVQLELDTTKSLYDIYDDANENQDYITMQWLMNPNGLIAEQSEEMRTSNKALEIAKMNLDWISKAKAISDLL